MLCLLIAVSLLTTLPMPVKATSGTFTKTFTSSASEGGIYKTSGAYATSQAATTGTVSSTATTFSIGQTTDSNTVHRGYVFFDLSSLPDGATITAAVLSLYIHSDSSTTDFSVVIQNGQPTYPHNPLEASDYLYSLYSSDGGNADTSTISGVGYWNITLSSTGRGWLSKTTETKLCLKSQEDISASAPTDAEFITVRTNEQAKSDAARLYITYTVSSTYLYRLYGPYEDAPVVVSNSTVNILVFYNQSVSEELILDGTYGIMDTAVISSSAPLLLFTWNVTSTGNYSRTLYIHDDTGPFIVFVPNVDTPCYLYTCSIIDMHGVTGGYLESRIYYNGSYQTVERHQIGTLGDIAMYMQWACVYDMQIVCDQGTLSYGTFTALGVTSINLLISYGTFPISEPYHNATISVLRQNGTWIQANYTDASSLTSWVNLAITHSLGGTTVTDYSSNTSVIPAQFNWYSADELTNYNATVTYLYNGTVHQYTYTCPAFPTTANPWGFISAPYSYGLAVGLTIAAGCVFSYATITGGAWAMVGLAAFFCWIGWLPQTTATYGTIGVGGLISGLITIGEWKKVEREI